ncbi:carbonic anhydrase, partial [Mycobacteroides franklinii]
MGSDPKSSWAALKEGNQRFVGGFPQHPSQGVARRAELASGQNPNVLLFGCS